MSTGYTNNLLFNLARNKLQSSFSHKDRLSLHRWVLLKNSIINSPTLVSTSVPDLPETHTPYSEDDDDDGADEVLGSVAVHSFMFPDAGNLVESQTTEACSSEAQWLDSLLETLGDDDDDDFGTDSDTRTEDEDEHMFSPSASPMSSSDDLSTMQHHSYYSSVSYPFISPYPPFHPPLATTYAFVASPFDPSSISSLPPPYEDPLPFSDDVDDLPVPDAIEDTSDDESDSPTTPSMGGSRSSLFSDDVLDAASIPLPPEPSSLRHGALRVYNEEDPHFDPFDPLPFSADGLHSSYNLYPQEC